MTTELEARIWKFVELIAAGSTEFNVLEGMADDLLEAKCNEPQWFCGTCGINNYTATEPCQHLDPWKHIPSQYKQGRWASDSDDQHSTFFVHCNGHRICDAEDSEVATAICAIYNRRHVQGENTMENAVHYAVYEMLSNLKGQGFLGKDAGTLAAIKREIEEQTDTFERKRND